MSLESRVAALEAKDAGSKTIDQLPEIINPTDPVFIPASTNGVAAGKINTTNLGGSTMTEDGQTFIITSTDVIQDVAPTAAEAPSPTSGDSAIKQLTDGIIEYWTYTTAWAKGFNSTPADLSTIYSYIQYENNIGARTNQDIAVSYKSQSVNTSGTADANLITFDRNIIVVAFVGASDFVNVLFVQDGIGNQLEMNALNCLGVSGQQVLYKLSQKIQVSTTPLVNQYQGQLTGYIDTGDITISNTPAGYKAYSIINGNVNTFDAPNTSGFDAYMTLSISKVASSGGGLSADGTKGIVDEAGNARFGGTPDQDLTLTLGNSRNFRIQGQGDANTYFNLFSSGFLGNDASLFEFRSGATANDAVVNVKGDKTAQVGSLAGSFTATQTALNMTNGNGSIVLTGAGNIRVNSVDIGTPVVGNLIGIKNVDGTIEQVEALAKPSSINVANTAYYPVPQTNHGDVHTLVAQTQDVFIDFTNVTVADGEAKVFNMVIGGSAVFTATLGEGNFYDPSGVTINELDIAVSNNIKSIQLIVSRTGANQRIDIIQ